MHFLPGENDASKSLWEEIYTKSKELKEADDAGSGGGGGGSSYTPWAPNPLRGAVFRGNRSLSSSPSSSPSSSSSSIIICIVILYGSRRGNASSSETCQVQSKGG